MTRILLRALNSPVLLLLVLVGIAIQSSLFNSWPLYYLQPDFSLLVVIWCALRRGFEEGGILTLLIGEINEIHSAAPSGVHLICYMTVYLMVRLSSRVVVLPTLLTYAVMALLGSMVWKLSSLLVLTLLGAGANQWRHTITYLFFGAAAEAICSLWVYRWLDKLDWLTFKNLKADQALEDDFQLESEGF